MYKRQVQGYGDKWGEAIITNNLGDRAQALAGGQVRFQLAPQRESKKGKESFKINAGGGRVGQEAPILAGEGQALATWAKGQPLQGAGLFAPFNLPPLAFTLTDWSTGQALILTATPETNLYALFAGFGASERQGMSLGTVKAIIVVVLVLMALALAQAFACLLYTSPSPRD